MTARFTPGPWTVEIEAEPDEDLPPAIYVCHESTVCDATVVATMGRAWSVAEERKLADARVIAAAPELVQALKTARNQVVAFGIGPAVTPESATAAVRHIDDLLAKIDGEAK